MLDFIKEPDKPFIDDLEKEVVHQYADINGTRIHYVEYGKGPLLVLIHGWTNDWSGFTPFMKELSEFQILAIDLPGYGESEELKTDYSISKMADILTELLKQINKKAEIICCLSMGSVIGVEFANKYPDLLNKLILVGPPIIKYNWLPSKLYRNMVAYFNSSNVSRTFGKTIIGNNLYGHLTARYLNMYRYNKELIDKYGLRGRKKVKKKALFQMGKAMYNYHMEHEIRKLTTPTLIIVGRFDRLIDLSEAEKIKNEMKNTELIWIEDAGHVAWLEKPREVAEGIKNYKNVA